MKKKTKIFIFAAVIVFLIALITVIIFSVKTKKADKNLKIAFYNTNESVQNSLTSLSQKYADAEGRVLEFYTLNNDSDFYEQIKKKKIDLIFAGDGYALRNSLTAQNEDAALSDIDLSALFSTMRQATKTKNKKYSAIPLLFDNLEINIETSAFKMSGMKAIVSWKDIEEFSQIQKGKSDYPVSFAGAEPVFLLDLLGALGEALEGKEAYDKAAEILIQASNLGSFDASEIVKKLFIYPDAPIPYSLYFLQQYAKKGYLTPASQYLKHTDINSYIQQRVTNLFFTSLSIHRTYDVKAISRFSSIYFPSDTRPEGRHFTANITYAVPVTKKAGNTALIQELISTEAQASLSQMTGLAPVLANCPTPDKESDDARYWIAATSTPLAGLGHEAFLTSEEQKELQVEILNLLF